MRLHKQANVSMYQRLFQKFFEVTLMKKHKKSIIFISIFLIAVLTIFIVTTSIYSGREKGFKENLRKAEEVRIMSGNTGEQIVLSKEDIEKLANKVDEVHFKLVLFPKQRDGWSYEISYRVDDNDWWSMVFGGGYTRIVHNNDWKAYQYNQDLNEFVGSIYNEKNNLYISKAIFIDINFFISNRQNQTEATDLINCIKNVVNT